MQDYKNAVNAKVVELIGKGWTAEAATKRARKACKHLHPSAKRATARNLALADVRFDQTGDVSSYNRI